MAHQLGTACPPWAMSARSGWLVAKPTRHRSKIPAAPVTSHTPSCETTEERSLRLQLGSVFPNALLLEGSRLPHLSTSRHYVNLTNGLDLLPLLQQLQLPFSVVRIRSTSLEQQAFEALLLELDANLLLALALGHSCVVWDTGCRNRKTGAPRALWYGLEFIRFALNRAWCGSSGGGSSSSGGSNGGDGSSGGGGSSGQLLRAHIRGHDVLRDFEAACRSLAPSTKSRLRYYKRYVAPDVRTQGVALAGAFRRTDRDEDVEHFVALARQHCGPPGTAAAAAAAGHGQLDSASSAAGTLQSVAAGGGLESSSSAEAVRQQQPAAAGVTPQPQQQPTWTSASWGPTEQQQQQQQQQQEQLVVPGQPGTVRSDLLAYQQLVAAGVGIFTAGLSHTEFRALDCKQP